MLLKFILIQYNVYIARLLQMSVDLFRRTILRKLLNELGIIIVKIELNLYCIIALALLC